MIPFQVAFTLLPTTSHMATEELRSLKKKEQLSVMINTTVRRGV